MGEESPEQRRETTTAHISRVAVKEKAIGRAGKVELQLSGVEWSGRWAEAALEMTEVRADAEVRHVES